MPYKNREDRLRWAREKYAKSPLTRFLGKIRTRRSRKNLDKVLKDKEDIKQKVRQKLRYAVKIGKIKKGICFCGEKKTEAHHEDYAKPYDVIWLCIKHHAERHRKYV